MKVPRRFSPSTRPSSQGLAGLNIRVDPNAFGAQLVSAGQALAAGLEQNARRRAVENNVGVNLQLATFQLEQDEILNEYNRESDNFSGIDTAYSEQFTERANAFLDQIRDPEIRADAYNKLTSMYLSNMRRAQELEQQRNVRAIDFQLKTQYEQARNIVRTDPSRLDEQTELIVQSLGESASVLDQQTIRERTRLYLQDLTYDAVKGRADQNPEQVLLELQTGAMHDPAAAALMYRESGGNPAAFNSEGYAGLYQFGAARVYDLGVYTPASGENLKNNDWKGTFNIPGHPEVKTIQDFLHSPLAQQEVWKLHQQKMDNEIIDNNFDSYIGKYVDGVLITRAGLHNMLHLGGVGSTRKFLSGRGNPKDSNGTSMRDYAAMGANATGRAGGLDMILRPDQKENLIAYAESEFHAQAARRNEMDRLQAQATAQQQQENYAQLQVQLAQGQLTPPQMVDALARGDISTEQYRTLRSDYQTVTEQGNPEAALLMETLLLRDRAGLQDIFNVPGLSVQERRRLVNTWDTVQRQGGVLARADVKQELDRIDMVIGGVRGPFAQLDLQASERLANALQEARDRIQANPDNAREIADDVIRKYRSTPQELSSLQPPRFFTGNVNDPPELLRQHVVRANELAREALEMERISEEEYEEFLLESDAYLDAIERTQRMMEAGNNAGN